jgi:DNA-binding IclR family transcriptional regulator
MKLPDGLRKAPSPQQRRYKAPALDKRLDILEFLASARLPLSQLEVAQGLGRTSGEIYRMLMCLAERGYVIREAESGKFRLTLRLYELGHKQNPTMLLRHAARVLPRST